MVRCIVFFIAISVALPTSAQDARELIARFEPKNALAWLLGSPEGYKRAAIDNVKRLGGRDGELSAEDIAANRQKRIEWRVSDRLRLSSVFDLDDDGQITPDEAAQVIALQPARQTRYAQILRDADLDADGIVSKSENEAFAKSYAETYFNLDDETGASLLLHDLDGDGAVTVKEVATFVDAVDRYVFDPDKCVLPDVPIDAPPAVWTKIVRAAAGAGQTNAAGEDEIELFWSNHSANESVHIVLALSETPVRWRVNDEGNHLDMLIVTDTALGVDGVAPEKVTVVPATFCTQAYERPSHNWFVSRAQIISRWGPHLYDQSRLVSGDVRWQF